jgi:hypothetical protein
VQDLVELVAHEGLRSEKQKNEPAISGDRHGATTRIVAMSAIESKGNAAPMPIPINKELV